MRLNYTWAMRHAVVEGSALILTTWGSTRAEISNTRAFWLFAFIRRAAAAAENRTCVFGIRSHRKGKKGFLSYGEKE